MTITLRTAAAATADVTVPLIMTAADGVVHGAGIAGNSQLLRMQETLQPDGTRTRVPYVSGNSLRHALRSALAWHLVRLLEVPAGSLTKAAVDLLWSGGSLSATGSQADLETARAAATLLPGLGLLGYSARSDIRGGTLNVGNVHVVCRENAWRLPGPLRDHPHAALPGGIAVSEEFGTRHDAARSAAARYLAAANGEPAGSVQMIYDAQVVRPGAVLWSSLLLQAPAPGHAGALAVACDELMPSDGAHRRLTLGGRRSAGFGTCLLDPDCLAPLGDVAAHRAGYEARLLANRDEALALIARVTG